MTIVHGWFFVACALRMLVGHGVVAGFRSMRQNDNLCLRQLREKLKIMSNLPGLQGVSNGLPHTTCSLPLGTPWRVHVCCPSQIVSWQAGAQEPATEPLRSRSRSTESKRKRDAAKKLRRLVRWLWFLSFLCCGFPQVYPEYLVIYERVHGGVATTPREDLPFLLELPLYWKNVGKILTLHQDPHDAACMSEVGNRNKPTNLEKVLTPLAWFQARGFLLRWHCRTDFSFPP